jgi:zinc transporter
LQELRHAAEEFSAAVEDSAALVERVKMLQEELAALVGEQSNKTLFVLTVVTVLVLPINVVTGLLGMNVGGMPLTENPNGFVLVISWLTVVTILLALLARRGYRL